MMKKILALLLAMVMLLSMAACGPADDNKDTAGEPDGTTKGTIAVGNEGTEAMVNAGNGQKCGVLNVRMTGDNGNLDPHTKSQACETCTVYHIFETPIVEDAQGNIHPLVCTYEVNDDATEITFKVREEVTFHDGTDCTAEDVAASINRWVEKGRGLDLFKKKFEKAVAVDADTVKVTFNAPAPRALHMMAGGPYIMKADFIESLNGEDVTGYEKEKYIGTGPYMFTEWVTGQHTLLTRYEDYVTTGIQATGMAGARYNYPEQIKIIPMTDRTTATMALIAKELDYGFSLGSELGQKVKDEKAAYPFYAAMGYFPNFVFNGNEDKRPGSIIHNKDFRKAIQACVDIDALLYSVTRTTDRMVMNHAFVTEGSVYDTDVGADVWNIKDKELAKQYLEASGYKGETIEIISNVNSDNSNPATVLVEQLKEIGINCNLTIVESTAAQAIQEEGTDWDIYAVSGNVRSDLLDTGFMRIGTWTGWENDEIIEIFEKLELENDPVEIQKLVDRVHEIIYYEEIPFIKIGDYLSEYYYRTGVEGTFDGYNYYFWNTWKLD